MDQKLTRRKMLLGSTGYLAAGCLTAGCLTTDTATAAALAPVPDVEKSPFRFCLNTGTITGHNRELEEEIEVAGKAGYDGIEPWMRAIYKYRDQGKSLADLRKRISDLGLKVESAIGFPAWAVEDATRRARGLEDMKRDMDLVAQLGGTHIAAPPTGINGATGIDLRDVAERYHAALELGRTMGVVPQLEIWGSAKTLGTVAEAAFVAVAANDPDACILLDIFHMYRGGSGFACLDQLNGAAMHAFHVNDYPAGLTRERANDSDRIYPGDGVAPMTAILRSLYTTGFRGALSLEVFNRDYWKQDIMVVAKTGLAKMKATVAKAMATS